jgi:hypothetical protein
VWEVWSKTDDQVYWVTEGVATILDHDEPHLQLSRFYPCPRPAYGTRRRRSLVPIPDYVRYGNTLDQISELTTRVYDLLREVRLKGFFPAGGDIGQAVETAIADQSSASILIPVPAAAFMGAAGGQMVQWLPLSEIATAIQGLLQARGQLIQDFYEISGISDIMRGATDAGETLGGGGLRGADGTVHAKTGTGNAIQSHRIPDSVFRIMRHKGGLGAAGSHPAVFPVALVEAVLTAFSDPGDLVYEPFCGSGTQIVTAERTGRRCFAMELDPVYCDVAVRRWEIATGRTAQRSSVDEAAA